MISSTSPSANTPGLFDGQESVVAGGLLPPATTPFVLLGNRERRPHTFVRMADSSSIGDFNHVAL